MTKDIFLDTTELALAILLAGTKKTLDNKVLTIDESKLVGKALGWLALMTVNTKKDIFADFIVAAKELKTVMNKKNGNASMMSPLKTNKISSGELITAYGGYRKRKMRGGLPPLLAAIFGALAILWGGNTAYTVIQLDNHRNAIRESGIEQINSACPVSLSLGAPPRPIFHGYLSAEYQTRVTQYEQDNIVCSSVRQAVASRVRDADTRFTAAVDAIPRTVGVVATAAVLAASGPVTTPTIVAATTLGGSIAQIASTFLSGSLPQNQTQMSALATSLSTSFPASGPPPPLPPPQGGKRRSTRRLRKSRKLTRRR